MHTWAAATHYLSTGAALGHDPNPWFDTDWYVQTYRDVAEAKINPLLHYVHFGGREGRRPSAEFDPHWYLRRNIDVALAGSPPLKHFLQFGAKEGRSPNSRAEREGGRSNARLSQLHMRILPTDGEIVETSEFVLSSVAKAAEQYRWRKRELPFASAWSEHPEITATGHVKADFPPPPYIVEMRNVALLGGARHIISRDNTLLHDELACFSHDQTVAIKRATDRPGTNGRIIVEFKRSAGNIVARGLHAMHEYGNNYFHFMTEVAPRVIAGRADASSRDLPLLVNGDLHQNFREVLDIVDEARPRLDLTVDKLYAGKEISFISDISSIQDVYVRPRNPLETLLHIGLIREVTERVLSAKQMGNALERRRKLYVRRGRRYRGLLNESEIEEILAARGFELVLLDGMSLAAQMRLFREASVVIAPTGAALTNIIWCQPGTSVIVLAASHEAMPLEIWSQLGKVSDCTVASVAGSRAYTRTDLYSLHDDYTIEPSHVIRLIG